MGWVKAKDLQRKPPGHQQAECGFLHVVHGVLAHMDTAMRDQEVRSQYLQPLNHVSSLIAC